MKTTELKNSPFLKDLLTLLNFIIAALLFFLCLTALLLLLSGTGLLERLPFTLEVIAEGISPTPAGIALFLFRLVKIGVGLSILLCARSFLRHLLDGRIFDRENLRLTGWVWKLFLLLSLLSIEFSSKGNPIALPFSLALRIETAPLLGALVVWILGKILSSGMDIAEENEFTI